MTNLPRLALLGVLASLAVWVGAWQTRRIRPVHAAAAFDDIAAAHRIPAQQIYSPGPDPGPPASFFEMSDPRVNPLIVRDIGATPEGTGGRWTFLKPALKFPLTGGVRRFAMDFSILDAVFRTTGPVTLSTSINGHPLGTLRCEHAGDFHFEKAVPAEWLAGSDSAVVEAVLDKVWTVPTGGARLGYILVRAGFLK